MDKNLRTILLLSIIVIILALPAMFFRCYTSTGDFGEEKIMCFRFWEWFGLRQALLGFLVLVTLIFWIWMLVDCIERKFKEKIPWLIIVVFLGPVGALVYYLLKKRKA